MEFFTPENLAALVSLTALEIVLGIDNIVFIAVITSRLPVEQQSSMRKIGLTIALVERILLLLAISWVAKLTNPLFSVFGHGFSGRDLILLIGGIFLIGKATYEIHGSMEGVGHSHATESKKTSIPSILIQIAILDTVFSLDSVITAVGMANQILTMVIAVVCAVVIMMIFANPISNFILRHPSVKMLALSFLLLVGFVLVAEGSGLHISKGYIYFAMGFSMLVEMFNFRQRSKHKQTRERA